MQHRLRSQGGSSICSFCLFGHAFVENVVVRAYSGFACKTLFLPVGEAPFFETLRKRREGAGTFVCFKVGGFSFDEPDMLQQVACALDNQ